MSAKIVRFFIPLLLLSCATLASAYMFSLRPDNPTVEVKERPLAVTVAQVVKQDVRIPVQAQGSVSPHRETAIVAEVSGKIIEVSPSFHAGGYVAEGELLLRIDNVRHKATLMQAQAGVASAQSALAQERGRAEVAKQEFDKFPSKQRSDTAKALYLRRPQLKQAEARLLSARADLRKAEHDLSRAEIRAPYNAMIKDKRSDLGLYLSPGTPVATLFAIDFAEVRLAVPQSKLPYLELPGVSTFAHSTPADVDLSTNVGGKTQHWTAKLHRTEGIYDERSRVLFVVARVEDPYLLQPATLEKQAADYHQTASRPLRMGTFVNAVIKGRVIENLVVLPRNILRAGNQLWVVDKNNTLRNRMVSTLKTQGDEIYITSGLQEKDQVCLTILSGAVAGSLVEVTAISSTLKQPEIELGEPLAKEKNGASTSAEKATATQQQANLNSVIPGTSAI